jgi:cytochrome o ubiquinol oxidase operon protein cyoD
MLTERPLRNADIEDVAPGDEDSGGKTVGQHIRSYVMGIVFATGLTIASFYFARSTLIWAPGIPDLLIMLAIAQMGIHLVFFLHISSGPDSTNNVLALAFGVLIVMVIIVGSLWIMAHLNHNMMPMDRVLQMQR